MSEVDDAADGPLHWDLTDLTLVGEHRMGPDDLLDRASGHAAELVARPDQDWTADATRIARFMAHRATVDDLIGRARALVELPLMVAPADAGSRARCAAVQDRAREIESRLAFFDHEWCGLPADRAESLLAEPELAGCRELLRRLRVEAGARLGEEAERVLAEMASSGIDAMRQLHHQLVSTLRVEVGEVELPIDAAQNELASGLRSRRHAAGTAISAALSDTAEVRATVLTAVVRHAAASDRLRRRGHWLSARNSANDLPDSAVDALGRAVDARYDVARRWYRHRARLIGVDRLTEYDRSAPVGPSAGEPLSWASGRDLVLAAFGDLDPLLGRTAADFFEQGWIDVGAEDGRRSGGHCAFTVPSVHPYVMLSWHGGVEDLVTLAHELGHGVHGMLARAAGIHHYQVPELFAETIALLAETVVVQYAVRSGAAPGQSGAITNWLLDRAVSTIFRLRALWRFEQQVHEVVRANGRLDADRLDRMWSGCLSELYGDAVDLPGTYRHGWALIPHFVDAPGYLYSYVGGQLLAFSAARHLSAAGHAGDLIDALRAGGSAPVPELLRKLGVGVHSLQCWTDGLDELTDWLRRVEDGSAPSALTAGVDRG
ncbi:M3 family metallopeptidase [Micromonospora sp. SD12]|uniref:M3 family metallopeptidase n=1 Tax=Micromonospora sp. SD12 TaxID=3452216 RepID=UPI003F887631